MDRDQEIQYGFCPKCGALTKNGVCESCSAGSAEAAEPSKRPYEQVLDGYGQQQGGERNPYPQTQETGAYYGSPYSEYANKGALVNNGAIPPDKPVKNGSGKAIAIVLACVFFFLLLIILLVITVSRTFDKLNAQDDITDRRVQEEPIENKDNYFDAWEDDFEAASEEDKTEEDYGDSEIIGGKSYGFAPEDDYYKELRTILQEDLSYSIEFKTVEYKDEGKDVSVYCYYPVILGDIPNKDYLNEIIYEEYSYFVDFYEENLQDGIGEDIRFDCTIEGYVTYMDDEKISIVFSEDTDMAYYFVNSLFCINIDVKDGSIIDNTEIIEATDDFSVNFRIREGEQNQSETLDVYTDQELTEMLNDSVELIIFYTPLGLEVGINHDYGWSTATYKDYEQYLKRF